MVKLEIDNGSA